MKVHLAHPAKTWSPPVGSGRLQWLGNAAACLPLDYCDGTANLAVTRTPHLVTCKHCLRRLAPADAWSLTPELLASVPDALVDDCLLSSLLRIY